MTRCLPFAVLVACVLLLAPARAARAQPPAAPPITHVLVSLTVKPGADRAQLMKVLPDEVRATVALYLDGKIQQWYSPGDGQNSSISAWHPRLIARSTASAGAAAGVALEAGAVA